MFQGIKYLSGPHFLVLFHISEYLALPQPVNCNVLNRWYSLFGFVYFLWSYPNTHHFAVAGLELNDPSPHLPTGVHWKNHILPYDFPREFVRTFIGIHNTAYCKNWFDLGKKYKVRPPHTFYKNSEHNPSLHLIEHDAMFESTPLSSRDTTNAENPAYKAGSQ